MLVFFSYAHEDEKLRDRLATHLALLKRQGAIADWYDREITAGTEWKGQIDARLDSARIILLLISSDFLASEYCYDIEMKRALERHETGQARVIPIFLRPVDWQGAPFSKLNGLPSDARPVTKWKNRDEAFENIARGIRAAAEELSGAGAAPAAPAADGRGAGDLYNEALRRLADNDYDGALALLNRTIDLDPKMAYAFYNRGLTFYFKGDDVRAIADFNRSLELGFDDALLFRNRANAYSRRGHVQPALDDYARAIDLDPQNPLAYLNRGEVYANTLQKALAIADFKAVLGLDCGEEYHQLARQRLTALGVKVHGAQGV